MLVASVSRAEPHIYPDEIVDANDLDGHDQRAVG